MLWSAIEDYFIIIFIGFIIGVIVTRYYYERVLNRSLGRTIEGAVISNNVDRLRRKNRDLETILRQMMEECDSLTERIMRIRDIENEQNGSEIIDSLEDEGSIQDAEKENNSEET